MSWWMEFMSFRQAIAKPANPIFYILGPQHGRMVRSTQKNRFCEQSDKDLRPEIKVIYLSDQYPIAENKLNFEACATHVNMIYRLCIIHPEYYFYMPEDEDFNKGMEALVDVLCDD